MIFALRQKSRQNLQGHLSILYQGFTPLAMTYRAAGTLNLPQEKPQTLEYHHKHGSLPFQGRAGVGSKNVPLELIPPWRETACHHDGRNSSIRVQNTRFRLPGTYVHRDYRILAGSTEGS